MAGLNTETNEKQYDINMLFVLFLFAVVSCLYIFYAQQMPQYSDNFAVRQLIFYFVAFGLAIACCILTLNTMRTSPGCCTGSAY
ncbi:hypothetical protein [Thalassobacillus sp. C254]|uniref:hypothetical protein n=1 Tax=Thalassobacillus sp. C254 TaxID=1225341 RepID=UPI0006D24863|nr:hypothetical protein [Thalassobacillus sp. C254]